MALVWACGDHLDCARAYLAPPKPPALISTGFLFGRGPPGVRLGALAASQSEARVRRRRSHFAIAFALIQPGKSQNHQCPSWASCLATTENPPSAQSQQKKGTPQIRLLGFEGAPSDWGFFRLLGILYSGSSLLRRGLDCSVLTS